MCIQCLKCSYFVSVCVCVCARDMFHLSVCVDVISQKSTTCMCVCAIFEISSMCMCVRAIFWISTSCMRVRDIFDAIDLYVYAQGFHLSAYVCMECFKYQLSIYVCVRNIFSVNELYVYGTSIMRMWHQSCVRMYATKTHEKHTRMTKQHWRL
jgi:hypothetical protein